MFKSSVLVSTLIVSVLSCLQAQEADSSKKTQGKVIGQLWHTNVSGAQFFDYQRKLTEELDLPTSPIMMMIGGGRVGSALINSMNQNSRETQQTRGSLIFLQSAPVPGIPHLISFQSVKDKSEYLKLVKQQSQGHELIGGDDRHESQLTFNLGKVASNLNGGGEDKEKNGEETESRSISLSFRISSNGSSDVKAGPANPPTGPMTVSKYYRYHDGFMYTSQLEVLHRMELPSGKSLSQTAEDAATDIRGEVDLREVPRRLKDQLWTGLQARALTYLQRFDNENAEEHAMRSAVGKGRLELLKAAMFDLDQFQFSLQFAKQPQEPIRFELEATARDESQLARTLKALSNSPSSLTSLRDADSPLMVSSTFQIPDWMQPLAASFVASMQIRMKDTADESVSAIIDQLFMPIQETLGKGLIDGVIRMEGQAEAGGSLIGGVRLQEAGQFQTALETLLVVGPGSDRYQVSQATAGDQTVLTLSTTAEFNDGQVSVPVNVHLAGKDGYLWFAVGGSSSLDLLEDHLGQVGGVAATKKARPLEIRMKLSEWLGGEDERFNDLPQHLLQQLERTLSRVFDRGSKMSMTINGKVQEIEKKSGFESYATKVLTADGSDVDIKVETSGRVLTAKASVGPQVIKFLAAQYVAATNRMFGNLQLQLPNGADLKGSGTSIRAITIQK